jgi:hypothetical protein
VRVWAHVDACTGSESSRTHVVEEDKRADHPAAAVGKDAPDLEATEVPAPGLNYLFHCCLHACSRSSARGVARRATCCDANIGATA